MGPHLSSSVWNWIFNQPTLFFFIIIIMQMVACICFIHKRISCDVATVDGFLGCAVTLAWLANPPQKNNRAPVKWHGAVRIEFPLKTTPDKVAGGWRSEFWVQCGPKNESKNRYFPRWMETGLDRLEAKVKRKKEKKKGNTGVKSPFKMDLGWSSVSLLLFVKPLVVTL